MSENSNTQMFFIGTMITSVVGGILLLFTDFAGWNGSNYYYGFYSYGYVGPNLEEPLSILPFLILAGFLFYSTYISYIGFSSNQITLSEINRAFYLAIIAFVVIFIGALYFIISVTLDDVWWWFDAGFYGGFIGSGLTIVFLYQVRKDLPAK